jgi:hypothetical protein
MSTESKPNGWCIRNPDTMFLCPYCKGSDFNIYRVLSACLATDVVSKILCRNCRWFKNNVELSVPWGPFNPKVHIVDAQNNIYHSKPDMSVLAPPPEETDTETVIEAPEAPKEGSQPKYAEVKWRTKKRRLDFLEEPEAAKPPDDRWDDLLLPDQV